MLAASGGSPPYTWSVVSGNLPPGLTLSSSGTITGTPSGSGMFTFTVRVTDSASNSATQTFTLTISSAVVITIMTPAMLPSGSAGSSYSQTLAASGGNPPYTWSVISGSLPLGLTLSISGAITGTLTGSGTFTFLVRVTDSASGSATQTFTITSLPHFAVGGGFVMGFYVLNSSGQPASFAISFYEDTGKPLALAFNGLSTTPTLSDTIVGNGAKYYEAGTPQAALLAGSGVISSNPSITIQALVRRLGSDGSYYEAAIPSTAGYSEFQIPFDATTFAANGAQIYTGFAIANLDPANSANIACTARDSVVNFIPNAVSVPALNPLGHWAGYLFPALTGLRGTLDCTSNTKIGSIALRTIGANAISALPVIPIR